MQSIKRICRKQRVYKYQLWARCCQRDQKVMFHQWNLIIWQGNQVEWVVFHLSRTNKALILVSLVDLTSKIYRNNSQLILLTSQNNNKKIKSKDYNLINRCLITKWMLKINLVGLYLSLNLVMLVQHLLDLLRIVGPVPHLQKDKIWMCLNQVQQVKTNSKIQISQMVQTLLTIQMSTLIRGVLQASLVLCQQALVHKYPHLVEGPQHRLIPTIIKN